MSGINPDYSKEDLWHAIERGEPISYTACVQVMEPEDADPEKLDFDPFDITKVWPKDQFPVRLQLISLTLFSSLQLHMALQWTVMSLD